MSTAQRFGDVEVSQGDDFVATVEIQRGPNNFFDQQLIADLAEGMEWLDESEACRAVVLCSQGKNFCAGANLNAPHAEFGTPERHLYDEAVRLFSTKTPVSATRKRSRFSTPVGDRGDLPGFIRTATDREKAEQDRLRQTEDFREGVAATTDRRLPEFRGR